MSRTKTAGSKRKADVFEGKAPKKAKVQKDNPAIKPGRRHAPRLELKPESPVAEDSEDDESDEDDDLSAPGGEDTDDKLGAESGHGVKLQKPNPESYTAQAGDSAINGTSSRESHQKQKALAQERKAAKANAEPILRSKKLWERLRLKSAVPKEERTQLVKELFEIITGQVKDFVFKHDSVRVVQCALKYATPSQRNQIARELQGSYRELAESKYAKFLIAKMVVRSNELRDLVVPEFYGHVKRLIRHPEASWIVDDIYRSLASKEQKAMMLREWYGPEFVIFRKGGQTKSKDEKATADLSEILKENPEKRGPIMQHLKEMTNQLVQKKTTGFTMLHDAMLQYFLNCRPGSTEATEFLEMLKDDEEGDCYRNLAFTKSGSQLVCLSLAYSSSKDRRNILRFFKTHMKLLAADPNGHLVLLTAFEVIDDTVMTSKSIFNEILGKDLDKDAREQELLVQIRSLTARIPLLYLLDPKPPKWLLTEDDTNIVKEVREIRTETSKKEPETRRIELVKALSQPLFDLIAARARELAETSFGSQFITHVLFGGIGDKESALQAVAQLSDSQQDQATELLDAPHVNRMFKALVQGGKFDVETKSLRLVDPPLNFGDLLYKHITAQDQAEIIAWAVGPNCFVVLAMLEAPDFSAHDELAAYLRTNKGKLEGPNPGIKLILETLGSEGVAEVKKGKKEKEKRDKKTTKT